MHLTNYYPCLAHFVVCTHLKRLEIGEGLCYLVHQQPHGQRGGFAYVGQTWEEMLCLAKGCVRVGKGGVLQLHLGVSIFEKEEVLKTWSKQRHNLKKNGQV